MSLLICVNQQNQQVGLEEKLTVHRQGILHRAYSVFIFQLEQNFSLLLQKRAVCKYHTPGLWTNTCCSHAKPGSSLVEGAEERLMEEMGFTVPLAEIGAFIYRADLANGLIEHEHDTVLVGFYDGSKIAVNPDEASECRWFTPLEIEKMYQSKPEAFTPWFYQAYNIAIEGVCKR